MTSINEFLDRARVAEGIPATISLAGFPDEAGGDMTDQGPAVAEAVTERTGIPHRFNRPRRIVEPVPRR